MQVWHRTDRGRSHETRIVAIWVWGGCRLKQRQKQQNSSRVQAAANRRAAEELRRQKEASTSWFSRVAMSFGVRDLKSVANRCSLSLTRHLPVAVSGTCS